MAFVQSLLKGLTSELDEQLAWMQTKLMRIRGLEKGKSEERELAAVERLVQEILKTYVDSLTQPIWIPQREWKFMKDKLLIFIRQFFPKAEMRQNPDGLAPDIDTILDQLTTRITTDFPDKHFFEGEELQKALKRYYHEAYEAHKRTIHTNDPAFYLCTIDLEALGGDLVSIWRDGSIYWGISGDYDLRDESLIEILAKAYFLKYRKEQHF